jgi:hypothetical protein
MKELERSSVCGSSDVELSASFELVFGIEADDLGKEFKTFKMT